MMLLAISVDGLIRSQNIIRRAAELNRFPVFLGYWSAESGLRNLFTIMKTHLRMIADVWSDDTDRVDRGLELYDKRP